MECFEIFTSGYAGLYINRIIASTIVRNPLYAGRQSVDEFLVEYADLFCRGILPIYAYDIRIFATCTELLKEIVSTV
jgi:hypothetical protein